MHGDEGPIVRRDARQCPAEVEALDARRRVVPVVAGSLDVDLDHRPAAAAQELAGLVRGHREEPRTNSIGIAQRMELAPGDEPSRLDGVVGEVAVAADGEGDPGHVGVVGRDQPGEGRLVARPRERDRRGDRLTAHRLTVHTL